MFSSLYYLMLLYVMGVMIEFYRTYQCVIYLDMQRNYISEELKLSNKELFIVITIISLFWFIIEPITIMKGKINNR